MPEKKEKTKVILVINDLLLGGAQMVVYNIAALLNKETFDVSITYLFEKAKERQTIQEQIENAAIRYDTLAIRPGQFALGIWRLYTKLRHERPAIVHCHLSEAVIMTIPAAFLARVPTIIVHEHNTHSFYSWKINALYRLLRPLVTLTICYSETVEQEEFGRQKILSTPPQKVPLRSCTIFNGINTAAIDFAIQNTNRADKRRALGVDPNAILVLSVGRLIAWKGQETLIRAFATIASFFPTARLLIVGEGVMSAQYHAVAAECGVSDRVMFLGARTDVFELFSVVDIFSAAYTYREDMKDEEAFGIATLEAMAFGLPVIVAENESAHKFITDTNNGMLVRSGDVADLTKKLHILLADETKRKTIGEAASASLRARIAWQSLIAIYERLYIIMDTK